MRTALSNRRTRYTVSPVGLVLGLFGSLVSAVFTYLITVEDDAFVLDPHRTVGLFTDLPRLPESPPAQWPLVLLAPALPVLQLVAVVLCSLSATRSVGPRTMTRPRLALVVLFAAVTVDGVLSAPAGLQPVRWAGGALVVAALAVPHRLD